MNNLASKIDESDKKLETINKELNEAVKTNKNLKELADFMLTFIRAQSDDSEAYEQLGSWGIDKSYPFREVSSNMYESIRRNYLERLIPVYPSITWPIGVDPVNFTSSDFRNYFKSLPPKFHAHLVNLIPGSTKLSDKEKMELLLDVINAETNTSNSLNAKYLMAIEFTHQQFLNVLFYKVFNKISLGSTKLQIRCKSKQLSPYLVS